MKIALFLEFVSLNGVVIAIALAAALLLFAWSNTSKLKNGVLLSWSLSKISEAKLKDVQLPPGPVALPVVGNLHLLGKLPHRRLAHLALKYGPIMYLRLGSLPYIVVSSPDMAKLILKTHDQNFGTRPLLNFGKNVMYGSASLAFSAHGAYWKQIRKVVTSQLLGPKTLDSFKFMRAEEMRAMVDRVMDHCNGSAACSPLNVSELAFDVTMCMSCRMILGKSYSDQELSNNGSFQFNLSELAHEFFRLAGASDIGEFIPWLRWLDVQGLIRRQKNLHKTFDAFMEKILEEHLQAKGGDEPNRDFTDELVELMLEKKFTRGEVKANMLEMLVAVIDTSSVTVEWAMSEMLSNHPSIMKKVQDEVERVVGKKNKYVQETDLDELEFLRAVVKETLRLHPPLPLLLPREAIEDCQIDGYHIPRGCLVTVNAWAVSRDHNAWGNDAQVFRPERFIEMERDVDVRGQHFEILPFGAGRRMCPGMALGFKAVQLILANLLHCFNWSLPHGMTASDLDMGEEFGLSTPKAVPLCAITTLRHR
ncbi:hypothetical protein SUGI_1020900 [Cryptomeria japonica]|uniref:cytochrome P450 71AU50 n=1 Tax=Cryptomeria japonica TaxID=3369 RepID=UPI002414A7D5|nr:cytochrome P450 71AU50 [Cryptomeria japonica]GLJ48358.1 hypothetical protein SUGI_1020900 [Cryptomeria japonica]